MENFQYYNPATIIFGKGSENKLNGLLAKYKPKSLLLVYSGDFIKQLGIYTVVEKACKDLGIRFFENGQVVPNPKVDLVRSLITSGKTEEIEFILAVGGGSAIDTAKAVSIGIAYQGDVWDFFSNGIKADTAIPIGVITTLPSSGSETSNCTIISNGLYKLGYEDDLIIPKFAIMNPEYTLTLPSYQTACGVADILSHLLERYFSDVKHTDVTDYLIEGSVKALLVNIERLLQNPDNYHARAEVQWLSSLAHNNLLDTGRIADWGSHRIEHELSAQYDITHGEGMAVVQIAWIKYASHKKPEKLAQLANRVFDVDYFNYDMEEMAMLLADKLESLFKRLGLKTSLNEMHIGTENFNKMADRATNNDTQTVGHYIPLNKTKIIDILKLAQQ